MASDDSNNDKPNLRPTKRIAAGGKSIYLHHIPNVPTNKSYIYADQIPSTATASSNTHDPFGIERPFIEYSLNKKQRWDVLNDFRQRLIDQSSSSSADELDVQSDSEHCQKISRNKKRKSYRGRKTTDQINYRLCEFHSTNRRNKCVSITTNTGEKRLQEPKHTYMSNPAPPLPSAFARITNPNVEQNPNQPRAPLEITYCVSAPPPKEKLLVSIRKRYSKTNKKQLVSTQRSKFTQVKENMDVLQQQQADADREDVSTDEEIDDDDMEDYEQNTYTQPKSDKLQLNDFIQTPSTTDPILISSTDKNLTPETKIDPKSLHFYIDDIDQTNYPKKFHRQISREEKLYNRDKATYHKMQKHQTNDVSTLNQKSYDHLMLLSFRTILVNKSDLTIEHLKKTFGKNFIYAQCYPIKYLICLTDRLKSHKWLNKSQYFPIYSALDSYLIIILNDEQSNDENFVSVQISLNMDLFANTIEIENVFESTEAIYTVHELVERTIQFITTLPFDTFKPIDSEINRKKLIKPSRDDELSDSEFLDKQIRCLQLLDKNSNATEVQFNDESLNSDVSIDEYELIKPEICTNCFADIDKTTPTTALKACAHWLCNDCWKQYIENAVKRVNVILCPEWNCCSVVDVGTMLSVANVRCMSVYERNIEKCLVNLSRSYVKCPAKSCENIMEVINSRTDHLRCRCGHKFCISCKKEPHFPATCSAYRVYMDEVFRNGDLLTDYDAITEIKGRNCVSCNRFIEKNGGCNHMTCMCGAQFCWSCTAYWNDHNMSDGTFRCPKDSIPLQEEIIRKRHNTSRRFYYDAISHRHQRIYKIISKQNEHAKRLLSTIPLDKKVPFDTAHIKSEIDKRESALRHLYEMVKYVQYLHNVCEFIAVAADGYGNNPREFQAYLQPLQITVFNMSQILEGGRGHKAIEQLNQLHASSEKIIERIRRSVMAREMMRSNATGYITS